MLQDDNIKTSLIRIYKISNKTSINVEFVLKPSSLIRTLLDSPAIQSSTAGYFSSKCNNLDIVNLITV